MSFLRQIPILETLSEMELLAVADALVSEVYSQEAIIFQEGSIGDKFYIIEVISFLFFFSISLFLINSF